MQVCEHDSPLSPLGVECKKRIEGGRRQPTTTRRDAGVPRPVRGADSARRVIKLIVRVTGYALLFQVFVKKTSHSAQLLGLVVR